MNHSGALASPLGRMCQSSMTEEERLNMRARYWRTDGVLVVFKHELTDDFDRQWAENLAKNLFDKGT